MMLRILPTDTTLDLHVFVDRSIIEAFGQGGRAAVTARVYPWGATSDRIGLYNAGKPQTVAAAAATHAVDVQAWRLGSANVSRAEVLSSLSLGPMRG